MYRDNLPYQFPGIDMDDVCQGIRNHPTDARADNMAAVDTQFYGTKFYPEIVPEAPMQRLSVGFDAPECPPNETQEWITEEDVRKIGEAKTVITVAREICTIADMRAHEQATLAKAKAAFEAEETCKWATMMREQGMDEYEICAALHARGMSHAYARSRMLNVERKPGQEARRDSRTGSQRWQ
jgi:hypothetical protein